MANTTINDVVNSFHSHPMSKKELPEGLEEQFFESALSAFELEIESLNFDNSTGTFDKQLSRQEVYVLGLMMYREYLIRENSRVAKINAVHGKDIQLIGTDGTKKYTFEQLKFIQEDIQEILHKLKNHAFE